MKTVYQFIICMLILAWFASCKTEQWAQKKIAVIEVKQPAVLFNYCGNRFPPVVFDSTRIEYIPGATIYDVDSVIVDCDSVLRAPVVTKIVRVPCPPSTHRVDTFTKERTVQVENKAKIEALTIERDQYKAEAQRAEQGRSLWRWIAIGLIAYTFLRWILKVWFKISLP